MIDAWIAQRGRQRALPHPRDGRPTEFLFLERGRRPTSFRLRQGLLDATAAADLRGRNGQQLHSTPHQLRHTFGTILINGGIGLPALMALMGTRHPGDDLALRQARLADDPQRLPGCDGQGPRRAAAADHRHPAPHRHCPTRCSGCTPRCSRPASRTGSAPYPRPPARVPMPTSANSATSSSPTPPRPRRSAHNSTTSARYARTSKSGAGPTNKPATAGSRTASNGTSTGYPAAARTTCLLDPPHEGRLILILCSWQLWITGWSKTSRWRDGQPHRESVLLTPNLRDETAGGA